MSVEEVYSDDKLNCENMMADYSAGKGIPEFQDHLLNCIGCYNWTRKRIINGDFHQTNLMEEVKREREKKRKKKQEERWKAFLEKKKQGETIK